MLRDLPKDVDMNANLAAQGPLLVVTDLMGTTLRDDGAVLPAYRTAFAECAIPFTEQELANWRGAHKLSLFTEFATRRYPADEAPKIAAAALTVRLRLVFTRNVPTMRLPRVTTTCSNPLASGARRRNSSKLTFSSTKAKRRSITSAALRIKNILA